MQSLSGSDDEDIGSMVYYVALPQSLFIKTLLILTILARLNVNSCLGNFWDIVCKPNNIIWSWFNSLVYIVPGQI